MIHSRILSACFICFFIAACDKYDQPIAVNTATEIKAVPETTVIQKADVQNADQHKPAKQKTTTISARPALKLSIGSIPVEHKVNDHNFLSNDRESTEINNVLFETLNNNQGKSSVNLSGKLLTNQDKLDNKQYLDSVDGVQINIEAKL